MTFEDPGKSPDDVWAPTPPPPPPPPLGRPERALFDGAFVGPIAPPPIAPPPGIAPPPAGAANAVSAPPPVSEAVLALPLGTGRLVAAALDLLTRPDAGLRSASFYAGFLLLVSAGPVAALIAVVYVLVGDTAFDAHNATGAWAAWVTIAALPAGIGYLVVAIESRVLATAVIGGRAEGRPLPLRASIAIARRRFWPVFWSQAVINVIGFVGSLIATAIVDALIGQIADIDTGVQLVASLLVGAPFVYVTAGIVLGEVGIGESIRRSVRLFRARKRLALAVTVFSVLSQLIVLLGVSVGLDSAARLAVGAELLGRMPAPLAVPLVAALVFAFGTLTFLVAAIAAAPAVFAFEALTHYTHGLEVGRRAPLPMRHLWDPYLTRGMAAGAIVAFICLVAGVLSLPG